MKRRKRKVDNSWKVHKSEAIGVIYSILQNNPQLNSFKYKHITIRNQRSRWGSCSSLGNLNFNYRIVYLPYELAEYLVIHEFCHLIQMNHSKDFWQLVSSISPRFKVLQRELRAFPIKNSYL